MCGRYYIESDQADSELADILEELQRIHGNSEAHAAMKLGEIFPTNIVPVLFSQGPTLMKWGYSGYGNRVINARSETVLEKPMFRRSMMERRCLLPASGYFEWMRTPSGGKSKQKYALFQAGQSTIYMAGLWREEQGEALPVFVILTKAAGAGIAEIHNRMPVILPEAARKAWLSTSADPGRLMDMAAESMDYRPVS